MSYQALKKLKQMNPPSSWLTATQSQKILDLDLDGNEIGKISKDFFDETQWKNKEIVKSIRSLNMKDCNITGTEQSSYKSYMLHMNHVTWLTRVSYCLIQLLWTLLKEIEPEAFDDLQRLQIIDMQNNQIGTLDEDLFAAQKPSIERIYLSHNKMTEVPTHLFRNMASLNDLRLSDNLILEIDPKAFESKLNCNWSSC